MPAKTNATKPAPAVKPSTAEVASYTTPTQAPSKVSRDGVATCPLCGRELPVTRFPTKRTEDGSYVRSTDECRTCRDSRRAAKRNAK